MIKHTILALIICSISVSVVSAQDNKPTKILNPSQLPDLPPAKKGDLICRCITTFLPNKTDIFYLKIDKKFHQILLDGESISMPMPVRGTTTFTLYAEAVSEEDKVSYVPVVTQPLKGAGNDHLIILSRPNKKTAIKSKSYNISTSNYPVDSIHLFNETPAPLGLQVNSSKATVKPHQTHTYTYRNAGRDTYTSAKVLMAYKGEPKMMSSKRLRLIPGRRTIMVCFPSKKRLKLGATGLGVITIRDMPNLSTSADNDQ